MGGARPPRASFCGGPRGAGQLSAHRDRSTSAVRRLGSLSCLSQVALMAAVRPPAQKAGETNGSNPCPASIIRASIVTVTMITNQSCLLCPDTRPHVACRYHITAKISPHFHTKSEWKGDNNKYNDTAGTSHGNTASQFTHSAGTGLSSVWSHVSQGW